MVIASDSWERNLGMSTLTDLINPYTMCGAHKLFEALRGGPQTAKELVGMYNVCKTIRQVQNVAGALNALNGIRVRARGNPFDETCVWSMDITNPASPLLKVAHPAAPPPTWGGGTASAPAAFNPKTPTKSGGYVPVKDYAWMKDASELGDNLYFVGPTGSGKTVTAVQLGIDLKAKFIRQNFDGETIIDNMIGSTIVTVEAGTSITEFKDGELTRACRLAANGEKVVYLADEVQAGKAEVLFKFHRVLEIDKKDRSRSIEVDGEEIKIPGGNLTIIGTGNSFRLDESGLYSGSNPMNAAFLNRWSGGVYYIDYADNEQEILEEAGVANSIANALVVMARGIRAKAKSENNPIICSTRQIIAIGQKAMKWGCRKAIELIYLNTLLSDERKIVDPIIVGIKWPK
jgi:MoxR-like ATPase